MLSPFLASLLTFVAGAPTNNFPFNSQLPPVARWGEQYSYTLSTDTFHSSDGSMSYSATDLPDWLSLDGLTLSGTPSGGSGDSRVSFTISASDNSGDVSSSCTLQITDMEAPTYDNGELLSVLEDSGHVSASNSYVLVPDHTFEIEFPSDFFSVPDDENVVGHYAVTSDHSPLPIWLNFDGSSGKFSGTAPSVNSQIAQAQSFSLLYIISTHAGFSSAAAKFNLVLGANVLTMNISSANYDATTDHFFSYSMPLKEIQLDGEPISESNVSSATAHIPDDASWLSWNSDNFTLSGTPPESAADSNVSVTMELTDRFNDAVSWDIGIEVSSKNDDTVFSTSSLPSANATRGQWFTYDLSDYILNDDVSLSLGSGVDWLSIHDENRTINGKVPWHFQSATVNITASLNMQKRDSDDDDDNDSHTAHLQLTGSGPMSSSMMSSSMSRTSSGSSFRSRSASATSSGSHSASASATSTSATGTATGTATSTGEGLLHGQGKSSGGSNKSVAIGCGVGIPVGLLLIAAILLFFCCRRRRQQKAVAAAAAGAPPPPSEKADLNEDSQISNPRPPSKGLAMAPVFRTTSSDSDSFVDALEYPGELNDDGTMISTPEKEGKLRGLDEHDDDGWSSPQRASTLNFLAMNGDNSSDSTLPVLAADEGAAGGANNNSNNHNNNNAERRAPNTGTGPHPIPMEHPGDGTRANVPRESWRHTNTGERRWQEQRMSHSSLASIVPTEPPTVQMTSSEFALVNNPATSNNHNNLRVSNPPSAQAPTMPREQSSGVLHRVGSHSSSRYSESVRDSRPMSEQISGHYRSESSTESHDSNMSDDSSGANFRPYRDEEGKLHWREENPTGRARLRNSGLDRKPSAAKTPKGDTGEFYFV